jgi:hypothetical protein
MNTICAFLVVSTLASEASSKRITGNVRNGCAADYNHTRQSGDAVDKQHQCPLDRPACVGYVLNSHYGTCSSCNASVRPADCISWGKFFDAAGGTNWYGCESSKLDPCRCSGVTCTKAGYITEM